MGEEKMYLTVLYNSLKPFQILRKKPHESICFFDKHRPKKEKIHKDRKQVLKRKKSLFINLYFGVK